jgi:catechol 2,3-dioxygenase-like lactoylglutathione lyase family enzyme
MAAQGLASRFTQVSYVVRDIDATAQWFRRALGVEFFGVRDYKLGGSNYPLTAGGKPVAAQVGIKLALARAGGRGELEIELIQPDGGDSIFSKFVERTGGGLHHVAFEVDDFDAAAQPLVHEGLMPRAAANGGNKIAYFDCRTAGASIIEVAQYEHAMRADLDRLKSPGIANSASTTRAADAPRLVQISYTVRDLDAVTDWFRRTLGVEYFGVTKATAGRDYQVLVRDQPVTVPFSLRTAMGRLGPRGEQEIEIIQPMDGPSPYREFLEERGEGLNHVSFLVPDFESAAERMRASGARPLIEFRGHGIRACYFDCRAAGASIVEIGYFDEKATAALERVKTPRDKRN